MSKAKMLGYNKPYTPNNRDLRRGNPFPGKKTGLVILDERTPFGEKEAQAAKELVFRKENERSERNG